MDRIGEVFMKEKIKKNLVGFIIGVITTFSISVIAVTYFPSKDVTYDNKESGLSSTNVQGAIDELYGVCTAKPPGEQIIEDAGLEKDPYECRYFFTGANPNNYITFNNEEAGWRIISVECDGTIKIIRNESISNQYWGNGVSSWPTTSLNQYLNNTYYNNLESTAKEQVTSHEFSIGPVTNNNDNLSNQIQSENSTKWNGNIGLITVSEYLRVNSNTSDCSTLSSNNIYNDISGSCKNTNWMTKANVSNWWTISLDNISSSYGYAINDRGGIVINFFGASSSFSVRPAIYLKSSIQITGDGSQSNPYKIE